MKSKQHYWLVGLVVLLLACSSPQNTNRDSAPLAGTGLSVEYFAKPDFSGIKIQQISSRIAFEWGESVPALGMRLGGFSARWTGYVRPEFSEDYIFSYPHSGKAALWIDGAPVASGAKVLLVAGKLHSLKLEFSKTEAEAAMRLEWSSANVKPELIPTGRLYPATSLTVQEVSAQAPPPNQNLLLNPDFEAGVGNWTRYGSGNYSVVTPGRSGAGRAASLNTWAWVQQDLPANFVQAGTSYTLEGWGRSVGGRVCTIGLSGGNSSSPNATFNQTLGFSAGWERKALSFSLPVGTVWTVVYLNSQQPECQFDDLDLRVGGTPPPPPPPPSSNLLLSGDFEGNNAVWDTFGGSSSFVSGRTSARAIQGSNFTWIQQDLPSSVITIGATYTLSGYAKANGGTCTIGFSGGSGNTQTFNRTISFQSTSWEQKSLTLVIPAGTGWAAVYLTTTAEPCQYDDLLLSTGTTPPPVTGNGLAARYYDNIDFSGATQTRTDPTLNFDWSTGSPITGIAADTFSVRWFGQLEAPNSETFTFTSESDDGIRLWINDDLIVDAWRDQAPTLASGTLALTAGQRYELRIEYYENGGGAVARLFWQSPSRAREIVPQRWLFSNGSVPDGPAPPLGFSASSTSSSNILLSWNAVTGATGYRLERRTDATAFAQIATPSATSFSDTGLTANTRYTYRLRSTFSGGTSAPLTAVATTQASGGGGINGGPNAATRGFFGPLRDWPLVATHAGLLPDGRVISWYSFDRIGVFRDIQDVNADFHKSTIVSLWNPSNNAFSEFNNTTTDLFCSGFALLPDGRFMVAGGNLGTPWGSPHINIFNGANNTWSRGPDMRAGRWYPSVTPLPNGEMLISGGTEVGSGVNQTHEVYQTNGTLRQLSNATTAGRDFQHYFPWWHVAPNGQVFYAGSNTTMYYLNTAGIGSWGASFNRDSLGRYLGSSVMYEPGKIMVLGGGNPATATTRLIDLGATGGATVRAGPNMANARTNLDATLLADGTLFANGGNTTGELFTSANAVFAGEIYNPRTNAWSTAASASQVREYHSVALLLPDATVWTAGGGGCGNCAAGLNKLNYEIFYPPYLFRKDGSGELAARPAISSMPSSLGYNTSFTLTSPDAASIQSVTLLALGTSTHAFNYTQRFISLPITARAATSLTISTPANANLAPPGFHMLFIINSDGVPSVARIVRVQ